MSSNFATTQLKPTTHLSEQKSAKKLIQARLPFKTISSPAATGNDKKTNDSTRKRKLSLSEVDGRVVKINKIENVKENLIDLTNDSGINKVIRIDESSEVQNKNELSNMVPCSVNIECMKIDRNSQKVKNQKKDPIYDNDVVTIEVKSDGEETEHSITIKLPFPKSKKKTNKSAEKTGNIYIEPLKKAQNTQEEDVCVVECKKKNIVQSKIKKPENINSDDSCYRTENVFDNSEQQSYQSEPMDVDDENVNAEKALIEMVESKEMIKLEDSLNDKNKKPNSCLVVSVEEKSPSVNKRQSRSKANISVDVQIKTKASSTKNGKNLYQTDVNKF